MYFRFLICYAWWLSRPTFRIRVQHDRGVNATAMTSVNCQSVNCQIPGSCRAGQIDVIDSRTRLAVGATVIGCCDHFQSAKYDGQNKKFNRQAFRRHFPSKIQPKTGKIDVVADWYLQSSSRRPRGRSDWLHSIDIRSFGYGIPRNLRRSGPMFLISSCRYHLSKDSWCGSSAKSGQPCELHHPATLKPTRPDFAAFQSL